MANGFSSRSRTATQMIRTAARADAEQGDQVGHAREVQRVASEDGQADVPRQAAQHQAGGRPALRRTPDSSSSSSGIQEPVEAHGHAAGRVTAATGAPATSVASSTSSREALPLPRVGDRQRPAVVLGPVARDRGHENGLARDRVGAQRVLGDRARGDVELHHGGAPTA